MSLVMPHMYRIYWYIFIYP